MTDQEMINIAIICMYQTKLLIDKHLVQECKIYN